ncbi:hypothetical protein VTP01DRAFT_1708 [Rhizomucor pusillus]|uniref:uncharacterized protein n=1 Tax=Rhizomucor pusillus TaxID=4840 RepID=UPI00374269D1
MRGICQIIVAVALTVSAINAQNYDISSSTPGYKINGQVKHTKTGLEIPLAFNARGSSGKGQDLYGKTITQLVASVDYETEERLHVKIADKDGKQFPVPDSRLGMVRPKIKHAAKNTNYEFKYTSRPFGFQVIRKSDKEVIFDTTNYPLVFEDQYLEVSTAVPDDTNIYGIGETIAPFRRDNVQNVTTIFARDVQTPFYANVYGAHPYYNEIRSNGKAHGTLLLNAHGMDVFFAEGRITYKIIGGILDFYFFIPKDSKPNSVLHSYTDLVGKPFMPSQWMLGWHHCRYGYRDIDHVQWAIDGYKEANIPLEIAWVDIDYMDRMKDFTFDPVKFPQERMIALSKQLHANKQKMITMVDPALSTNTTYEPYLRGREMDVFLKNSDGTEFVGQVWPGYTAFPDWWHPNATSFWDKEIVDWMNLLELDGIWIDMNEPASFCLGSCGTGKQDTWPKLYWEMSDEEFEQVHAQWTKDLEAFGTGVPGDKRNLLYPKYAINNQAGNLSEYTAAMTALHYDGVPHYDLHNLYGHAECSITHDSILKYKPDERVFLLTRSSFPGSGQYAGHWTGDNQSTWAKLKNSLSEIFNFQMFGISYSGADVCGFGLNTTEQLCTRWMEIGAFYPFARNHNQIGMIDQEPFLWNSTAEASRIAINIRYTLLPYYYTVFEESNRLGSAVWRPLIFEYPEMTRYADNSVQVLVGTDILLSPVLDENATSVEAEFPPGIWYDWYTHEAVQGDSTQTLDAPLTHIPIHIRGGSILPLKTPKYTVDETYATPYSLLVALDEDVSAEGRLYIDDGHSLKQKATSDIHFSYKHGVLQAKGSFKYKHAEQLSKISIVGEGADNLSTAIYKGKKYKVSYADNTATVDGLKVDLDHPFTIRFH